MKLLVLGGSGMLGHKLWQTLRERFDVHVTFRRPPAAYKLLGIFDMARSHGPVSALDFASGSDSVERVIASVQPQVVINCIGIVKQDEAARDPYQSIAVNSLFPHRLAQVTGAAGARLIHLSTDCVFTGRRGNYNETDVTDAEDLYGRTKLLGELSYDHCLTLRTSMIGRELEGAHGLVEWFLSQQGRTVRGFKRAVFSGLTTQAMAGLIADIMINHRDLHGLWHVAAAAINKFDLLSLVQKTYDLDIEIEPDESFICDRSLNGERFRKETGFTAPSWPEMITEMRRDKTPYDDIRRLSAGR